MLNLARLLVVGIVASSAAALAVGCAGTDGGLNEDEGDDGEGFSSSAVSSSGFTWKPVSSPADGTYSGGGAWNGGRACTGGLMAGSKVLQARIEKELGVSVDGYACRQNTADTSKVSMHGTGRALDIFASGTKGAKIADWLVTNHKSLGIQLVIYSHSKWNASLGPGSYSGPNPHTDHVHAELTMSAAQNGPGPSSASDVPPPDEGGSGNTAPTPTAPSSGTSSSGGNAGAGDDTGGGGGLVGTPCGSQGQCNPGGNGSGLMCSGGKCVVGCTSDIYCPGVQICVGNRCQ